MQIDQPRRTRVLLAALGALLVPLGALSACGAPAGPASSGAAGATTPDGRSAHGDAGTAGADTDAGAGAAAGPGARTGTGAYPDRIPGVGARMSRRIPVGSRQAVVVYGEGRNSPRATLVLYTRHGDAWRRADGWAAHNGRDGWTTDHRMGDERSPVGVFTLSDAGGALPDPGARLPYGQDGGAYAIPREWGPSRRHDFDYVIAIDYNRVRGTPPHDPRRPEGAAKGGGIWLHLDHGSGTSACVGVPRAAMRYLLRTLDPARHPVVVMGDKAELGA
ncbi:hypothetical protein ACIPRD_13340 [Streptomyces sp. NPDC090108]|uniref:hypothetical protein n=1 Tax=Streptomyces sp. NPDC090108 TaxID=3365947 RepID=UPI003826F7FD